MPKAPRPGVGRRQQEAEWVIRVPVDGKIYSLRPNELSAVDVGDCRTQAPMTFNRALAIARQIADDELDYDIDVTAILVWLSRRQHGEVDLAYRDVAAAISYGSDFTPVPETDETLDEGPDDPEA